MKNLNKIVVVLACFSCFALGFAQVGGGGEGGGGRGHRGQRGNRNSTSEMSLIRRTDVQTDLQLTDEEKSKVTDLLQSFRGQRFGGAGAGTGGGGGSRSDMAEYRQRQEEQAKQVEALLTPDQVKRLHEIRIQLEGEQAVAREDVQTELGLSDSQKSKIKELQTQYMEANRSIGEKMRDNSLDQTSGRQEMQKNSDTLKQSIRQILTAEQLAKLKDMGGKPFTPDQPSTGG